MAGTVIVSPEFTCVHLKTSVTFPLQNHPVELCQIVDLGARLCDTVDLVEQIYLKRRPFCHRQLVDLVDLDNHNVLFGNVNLVNLVDLVDLGNLGDLVDFFDRVVIPDSSTLTTYTTPAA